MITPGIYEKLTSEDYHAMRESPPMLSSSIAKILVNETPLHAWHQHSRLNPNYVRTEKNHFDIGTIAHALILEGSTSRVVILDHADRRTKKCREEIKAARAGGKIPILKDDWADVMAMAESAHLQIAKNKLASDAFTKGKPEVTIVWMDEGVLCKARLDWLHDSRMTVDDYKTCANGNPETLARTIDSDGLDIQEAFYRRGLYVLTGNDVLFRFIFQEKAAPYALSVVALDEVWRTVGEKKRRLALEIWKKCSAQDKWPGYPESVCYPEMPVWMEEKYLKKESDYALHHS